MRSHHPQMFPALRSRMGDWSYYVTTMTFEDVARWIQQADRIKERREFKTWIQREIDEGRKEQIARYLRAQKQRFFNAVVVGIFGGEPDWFPVEVGENPSRPDLHPGTRAASAFGLLLLSGTEEVFAIDGQHRVEGVKVAITQDPALKDEELCVIFVGHRKNKAGHARTRRLFFTLNRYAKPVSKADLIALSEDDAYAIATRRLTEDFEGLDEARILKASGANIPPTDKTAFTTLVSLYNSVEIIAKPRRSSEHLHLKYGPLKSTDAVPVFETAVQFWKSLKANIPAIRQVLITLNPGTVVKRHRHEQGGHALFRPLGLRCFTEATRVLIDRGELLNHAVARLGRVPMHLDAVPWKDGVLWNQHVGRMAETKNAKLITNLFLYLSGQPLTSRTFDLLGEYQSATGNEAATLPNPRITPPERRA
jgi:DNA sulfur modification protein DndB